MFDHDRPTPLSALRRFFGVPFRERTYRNLAFLALAFPLGLAYFVAVTTGVSLGLGLLPTLAGIPILLVALYGATVVAEFEARLVQWLVGEEVALPTARPLVDEPVDSRVDHLLTAVEELMTRRTTWTSLVLLLVKFAYGVLAFVVLVTAGAVTMTMVGAPVLFRDPGVLYRFGPWAVETMPQAMAVAVAGVLFAFASLHVLNGLARLWGIATTTLLGEPESVEAPTTE
ncbi:MAG: sensor domain-containing protein [Halanaeroarchaeum sp.]